MSSVKDDFLRYAVINTRSNEGNSACPSSENQRLLAQLLKLELPAL